MKENITAAKAREIATYKLGDKAQTKLNRILSDIEKAANENKYAIQYNEYMTNNDAVNAKVIQELRHLGFEVNAYSDQRDQTSYTTISW